MFCVVISLLFSDSHISFVFDTLLVYGLVLFRKILFSAIS